ncbi:MAG: hypothetical protein HYZ27_00055 [Deltaproteobacteria bacterium]|nr:hypothetical protein [Deltaproteobacteria bacterium]
MAVEHGRKLRYAFGGRDTSTLSVEPRRALAVYRALDLSENSKASRTLLGFSGRRPPAPKTGVVISTDDCDALAGRLRYAGYPLSDAGIRLFKLERGFSNAVRISPEVAAAYARYAQGVEARLNVSADEWNRLNSAARNALRILLTMGREPSRLLAVRRALGVRDSNQAPDGVILVGRVTAERLMAWAFVHGWSLDDAGLEQLARACGARPGILDSTVARFVADAVVCRGEPLHDYARITRGGHTLNRRTVLMLRASERLLDADQHFRIAKGSYLGEIGRGAHPHLGGGAVDVVTSSDAPALIANAVAALRQVGFAAWFRSREAQPHIHAVAVGDRELSPSAAWQVKSYFEGRDGRSRSEADPHAQLCVSLPAWIGKYRVPYF